MQRSANPGKLRWAGKARGIFAWASLGVCAGMTAAGCSTTPMTAAKDNPGDPLLGSTPPVTATPPANAQAWLPPIPQNNGVATNAALAGQTQPPQALAIGSPPSSEGWLRKI